MLWWWWFNGCAAAAASEGQADACPLPRPWPIQDPIYPAASRADGGGGGVRRRAEPERVVDGEFYPLQLSTRRFPQGEVGCIPMRLGPSRLACTGRPGFPRNSPPSYRRGRHPMLALLTWFVSVPAAAMNRRKNCMHRTRVTKVAPGRIRGRRCRKVHLVALLGIFTMEVGSASVLDSIFQFPLAACRRAR